MPPETEKKGLNIVVVIRTDPHYSRRPVEAIRMALGLGAGINRVEIILMGNSPLLLTEDEEIQDYDILEKYLPGFEDAENPFLVEGAFLKENPGFESDYLFRAVSAEEITGTIAEGDRFLIF